MPRKIPLAAPHDFSAETRIFRAGEFFEKGFPFAVTRTRHRPDQFKDGKRRTREFWKITLVERGGGALMLTDQSIPLEPGVLFVSHPTDPTTYAITGDELLVVNILFLPDLFMGELERLTEHYPFFHYFHPDPTGKAPAGREPLVIQSGASGEFARDALFLAQEFHRKDNLWRTVVRHRLLEMLLRLSRTAFRARRREILSHLADFIDARIQKHLDEPLSLRDLARDVNLSPDRLGKRYKAERGITVVDALHQARVAKARDLLTGGGLTVTEVCQEVGFGDLSYFHRIYRRLTGHAPGVDLKKTKGI